MSGNIAITGKLRVNQMQGEMGVFRHEFPALCWRRLGAASSLAESRTHCIDVCVAKITI